MAAAGTHRAWYVTEASIVTLTARQFTAFWAWPSFYLRRCSVQIFPSLPCWGIMHSNTIDKTTGNHQNTVTSNVSLQNRQ